MANSYTGLTLVELTKRRTYLLAVLNGESMESFGGQGANFKRRIPSLDEARADLALVVQAITALDPTKNPITRTRGVHSSYQYK